MQAASQGLEINSYNQTNTPCPDNYSYVVGGNPRMGTHWRWSISPVKQRGLTLAS